MHATHPWNVTLPGRISSSGSLLVLRLSASSTPNAWTPRDLGFSLTDNWCVVWDPPLMAQLCCLSHRCPMSHRPHYIAEDTSVHPGDRLDHSSAPWLTCLARHQPTPLVGPNLRGPIITSGQQHPRTSHTSPSVSSCNLFSEETKSLPW